MSFYNDTLDLIRDNSFENGTTLENEMTDLFIEYISDDLPERPTLLDCENTETTKSAYYYKLNAYSYSEENGILDLFVTKFYENDTIATLLKTDIDKSFNALRRFFNLCISGNELIDKYKEVDPDVVEVVEMIKEQYNSNHIDQIRFYLLSNGAAARDYTYDLSTISDKEIPYEEFIIDINHIQSLEENGGATYIDVELKDIFHRPLECIEIEENAPGVKCYLAIMPAAILARIYDMFKTRLLDRNVRGFLGMKAINKAMYETIQKEPSMFFTYNNGISSTASDLEISVENGIKYINRITNWQIVNGGQSTNTIYKAFIDGIPIEKVNVFMKLSVISNDNPNQEDIIAHIAEFANSQNKVDSADLCSNHVTLKDLDYISRKEWAPINSARKQTRWYFERTKGQYLAERARVSGGQSKSAKAKKFDKENPKKQKFDKAGLSLIHMSWNLQPEIASLGGIKCFKTFWSQCKESLKATESYYHNIVACAIINQAIDQLFKDAGYKGYANFVRYYVLAILSLKSGQKLDLENIWRLQCVPESLMPIIRNCVDIVFNYLKEKAEEGKDPSNEAKKIEFWNSVKTKVVSVDIPKGLLIKETEDNLTEEQIQFIDQISSIGLNLWKDLYNWGLSERKITILERKRVQKIILAKEKGERMSLAMAQDAKSLLNKSITLGFSNK